MNDPQVLEALRLCRIALAAPWPVGSPQDAACMALSRIPRVADNEAQIREVASAFAVAHLMQIVVDLNRALSHETMRRTMTLPVDEVRRIEKQTKDAMAAAAPVVEAAAKAGR